MATIQDTGSALAEVTGRCLATGPIWFPEVPRNKRSAAHTVGWPSATLPSSHGLLMIWSANLKRTYT